MQWQNFPFLNALLINFFGLFLQSLLYLPLAIANALTAKLNGGYAITFGCFFSIALVKRYYWRMPFNVNMLTRNYVLGCRSPLFDEHLVLLGYCAFTGKFNFYFRCFHDIYIYEFIFSPWVVCFYH